MPPCVIMFLIKEQQKIALSQTQGEKPRYHLNSRRSFFGHSSSVTGSPVRAYLRRPVQADAPRGYSKVRIAPGLLRPPGLCARSAFYLSLSTQNIQIRLYISHFGRICQGRIGCSGTVPGKIPQKRGLIFFAPSGRIQSAAQFFSGGRAASK